MTRSITKTLEWNHYLLPAAEYANASRAERMKHRRKMIKAVERKMQRIMAVEREGTAKDKRAIKDTWVHREQNGALRTPRVSRQTAPGWENVGF